MVAAGEPRCPAIPSHRREAACALRFGEQNRQHRVGILSNDAARHKPVARNHQSRWIFDLAREFF
jgi:hypothetical protein